MLQARLKDLGPGDEALLDVWLLALPCNIVGADGRRRLTCADGRVVSERKLLRERELPTGQMVLLQSVLLRESPDIGEGSPICSSVVG